MFSDMMHEDLSFCLGGGDGELVDTHTSNIHKMSTASAAVLVPSPEPDGDQAVVVPVAVVAVVVSCVLLITTVLLLLLLAAVILLLRRWRSAEQTRLRKGGHQDTYTA